MLQLTVSDQRDKLAENWTCVAGKLACSFIGTGKISTIFNYRGRHVSSGHFSF